MPPLPWAFDAAEALRIVAQGEGRQIELKEGVAADGRIARTLCAFANTRGGVVLVGVSDRGRILGVSRPRAVAESLAALAARAVEPAVAVAIAAVRVEGKNVVGCSTPLSPLRPHAVAGASGGRDVFVRAGSSSRRATPAEIAAIGTASSRRIPPDPLEARILREVARADGGGATLEATAIALDAGKQRVRQAFERLERAGFLIAHGLGPRRLFWCAPPGER